MKKINLKSSELSVKRERRNSGNTALSFGVVLLLIAIGSYGVLMLMNQNTNNEITVTEGKIEKIKKELDSDEFHELYDFQSRLYEVEELIGGKIAQSTNLEKISKYTLPETFFLSLEQEIEGGQSRIDAIVMTDNHYTLSQQLEAYSLMEGAKEISLVKSENADEGGEVKVKAEINFSIK